MNNTFIVPPTVECLFCQDTMTTVSNELNGITTGVEILIGTHFVCMQCKTQHAVIPDGVVICTLGCDVLIEGSHPCN